MVKVPKALPSKKNIRFRQKNSLRANLVYSSFIMKNTILTTLLLVPTITFANSGLDLSFQGSCENPNKATISFVGDILIHKAIYKNVVNESKDFSQIWRPVNPMIQKANFSVANLEGPTALGIDGAGRDRGDVGFVYDSKVYSGTDYIFNYHPRLAYDLKKSGYGLVSFANNHSLDRKSIGVDKTVENLREAGLLSAGARASYEGVEKFYSIVPIEGINVAFLACTDSLNGQRDSLNQILNCYNGQAEALIKELASSPEVDFVVMMPHWGDEYQTSPNQQQRQFAKRYAEAGAGAIIGSHPHVPQPWEKYITTTGRETLIVYSLGNFVAWQSGLNNKTGPIVYLNISQKGNAKAQITGAAYSLTQRQGSTVYPVTKNSREFIRNGERFYGSKNFILPDESLSKVLCQ